MANYLKVEKFKSRHRSAYIHTQTAFGEVLSATPAARNMSQRRARKRSVFSVQLPLLMILWHQVIHIFSESPDSSHRSSMFMQTDCSLWSLRIVTPSNARRGDQKERHNRHRAGAFGARGTSYSIDAGSKHILIHHFWPAEFALKHLPKQQKQ